MRRESHLVEELLLGDHEGGLGVGDEDEDVRVEAELVDPVVQVGLHVDAGRVDDHDLLRQHPALFLGPEDTNFRVRV